MTNQFRRLKEIADLHGMDLEDVIHVLMATTYMGCCPHCNERIQSDTFLKSFNHLAEDFEFCREMLYSENGDR